MAKVETDPLTDEQQVPAQHRAGDADKFDERADEHKGHEHCPIDLAEVRRNSGGNGDTFAVVCAHTVVEQQIEGPHSGDDFECQPERATRRLG